MRLFDQKCVLLLACTVMVFSIAVADVAKENQWLTGAPILLPGPQGLFDEVAVKDPSIVFFEGQWHVFYTARGKNEYTTGYVSAETLDGLHTAQRHELTMIRGRGRYGCAPQILYYEAQQKWYLIFQSQDSDYQPMFSTTPTISKPDSWSDPTPLLTKDTKRKWIDFWVICDEQRAYLFYTEGHSGVMVRSTSLKAFPKGWGKSQKVFDNIHEAVHVYKAKGRNEYHMIYELNREGVRSFGLATATQLEGPWEKVTDHYATGKELRYGDKMEQWTEMVSHGEVLRSGYDEHMEYDPQGCRWLIQGIMQKDNKGPYELLPWRLGLITKIETGGEHPHRGEAYGDPHEGRSAEGRR